MGGEIKGLTEKTILKQSWHDQEEAEMKNCIIEPDKEQERDVA